MLLLHLHVCDPVQCIDIVYDILGHPRTLMAIPGNLLVRQGCLSPSLVFGGVRGWATSSSTSSAPLSSVRLDLLYSEVSQICIQNVDIANNMQI